MSNPPIRRATQKDYVQSALRLPPALNEEIKESAARNGRSMNAEIIARLSTSDTQAILAELAELKALVRRLISD